MIENFKELYNRLYILFQIYLYQLLIFTFFRVAFTIRLSDTGNFYQLPLDVGKAFIKGLQFDTAIILYGLVVPLLAYLLCSFIPLQKYKSFSSIFVSYFCGATTALFTLILFIDQYYYGYFQSHINVLIFGLIDDDTNAVMRSVWSDYPIIRILLTLSAILVGYGLLTKRIHKRSYYAFKFPIWAGILGCFIILFLFFIGMRQSLGTFPLQSHDGSVSKNKSINFLIINGVWALNSSFEERAKSLDFEESALNSIKALGYNNAIQAAQDYFPDTRHSYLSDSSALETLFQITKENTLIEQNKPNVVFIFMESMSNYNMNFDSKELDLLGSLRKHFHSDLLFRNFVSSGNATIQSLEYLMINTPISVTQSKYRFFPFPSATALPFKEAGYENSFITGGETSWRNLNEFVPFQGFESIKGKQDILADNKDAESNHWGAYDEYLFDYAFKKLSAKSKKPQFIFLQTTTNHTPFDLPDHYNRKKLLLSNKIKKRLLVTEELALKNLSCFHYSNNCLGNFLDKIKSSPLSKNTIVVMTGDHNNLSLFDFNEAHQLQQRGVPLYIYIPDKFKPNYAVNTSVFGSHKDIFPTIYNLALSKIKYYSIGNNILEPANQKEDKYFGINIGSNTSFSNYAAVNYSAPPILYKMNSNQELVLDAGSKSSQDLLKRSRSNYALSLFYILNSIKKHHSTAN
jgi:phosphoglycerol transferase MdoB-like AlkP superfamily enzyme